MRMTTAGRKPITCWPETDAEGGIECTSRGDTRKDWQRIVGGKAGAEEIGGALRTRRESLSEIPRAESTQSAKQPTNQNKQNRKKQRRDKGQGGRGQKKRDTRGEKGRNNGVKYRTKPREHQVNYPAQRVKDKGRRGGSKGHLSSHLCGARRERVRVFWERKGLGFFFCYTSIFIHIYFLEPSIFHHNFIFIFIVKQRKFSR